VAAINMDVFTRLELVPQMKMRNFMRNRKALSVRRVVFLNSDYRRFTLADQEP
jgi:hypothetical protein